MSEGGTLVLGVGSPLMADDGLGVRMVAALAERWTEAEDLRFLDGGVWGMRILPYIEAAERMVLIDVIRAGRAPGTFIRLERHEIPRHLHAKLSPHQIDLGEVLALAELRGTFPADAVALGIEPQRVELQEGLSPVVEAGVPALLSAVEGQLRAWGHALQRREAPTRA